MTDTITGLLAANAERAGDREAFRFLEFTGTDTVLTWADLYARALGFAHELTGRGLTGQRALLVYDSGTDFQIAFLGCLLAGVTAVPAPPPRVPYARSLHRLAGIQRDCAAPVVVTRRATIAALHEHLAVTPELAGVDWLTVEDVAQSVDERGLNPFGVTDLAYLQYTSGSTSQPKGVAVTQADVLANCAAMDDAWRHDTDSVLVSWLPMFHDMGLVYCGLLPVVRAMPTVLMTPSAFAARPLRWLTAMAEFGGTHSIAPNFGFDLCVRKVTVGDAAGLDLSAWRVVVNASEPIRATSLRRFTEIFAGTGFRGSAILPAYGLAEATLMVTSARAGAGPIIGTLDDGREVVSCGSALAGFEIRVVDPTTGVAVADGRSGEVWVAGPSVTAGYFQQPSDSFGAVLDGRPGYLRTGDIGFLRDGELYVTSRRKDLIIVAGRNHHPHDLEATAFEAHPALRLGCAAAFSVDDGAEEHVVVVCEVTDDAVARPVAAEAIAAVRQAVAETHELRASAVVLIRKSTLDKTSSGKIQRSAGRVRFADGTLDVVASWRSTLFGGTGEVEFAADVRTWLRGRVSALTGVAETALVDHEPLASYGIGSIEAADLTAGLADLAGRPLPDSYLYDHPTIARVTANLNGDQTASRTERTASRTEPTASRTEPTASRTEPTASRTEPTANSLSKRYDSPSERYDSLSKRYDSLSKRYDSSGVAIVGIGCRVPGASSVPELWELLRDGRDAVGEVPADRWAPVPDEPALRWAGLVDDLTTVDTGFFGLSPREAAAMDPQQRMLLAVSWEAVEDAGLDPFALAGTDTGCFVGVWSPEFAMRADFADPYLATGSAHSIAANRLSYQLDLRGPSMAIDTACSSSLVAVHLAVRSLLDGECSVALAGGSNVVLSPEVTGAFAKAHLLSPTGRCRSFGADADGYVRAEGAAVVVLKRLADARADGDDVYAVIRGSAVNHDGRTNGLTAPSGAAQEAVIRAAHRRAGTRPGDVDLVEAHGSGTPVGDLIEATALGATVGAGRTGEPCVVGSVKSNLGHLEAAAGVVGLVRAALALHRREVPPTLHVDQVNPRLDLVALGLSVNTKPVLLPAERPALAGVSSFGFGGANAHVVLAAVDAAPSAQVVPERAMLLPVSARTETALAALAQRYRTLLADPSVPVAAVCHSAGRRAQHGLRAGVVGVDRAALIAALEGIRGVPATPGVLRFAFGEQGQVAGRAARLFLQEPVFRAAVTACEDLAGWSLTDVLVGDFVVPPELVGPVRVAIHIGLVDLLAHWGIRPDTATGTGVGALSAAYATGVLDRATAMVKAVRGEPGPALMATAAVTTVDFQAGLPDAIALLGPGADDRAGLLAVAARLYETGYDPDWARLCGTNARVRPPGYPWDGTDLPLPGTVPAIVHKEPEPAPPPTVSTEDRAFRDVVRVAVADLLGTTPDRVDNHSTFHHLGMDSMTGVDLHERLELDLGVELPETAVLNYPTVARMAEFLTTVTAPAARSDEEIVDALLADLLPLLETDRPGKD